MKTNSIILACIQVIIAIGAIPAGLGFLIDTSGIVMGASTAMLANSPFETFLIPGLFLFLVNGIGNAAGSLLSFRNHRIAGNAGLLLGVILCLWILIQVYWIGLSSFLQPLFLVVGLAEVILSLRQIKNTLPVENDKN